MTDQSPLSGRVALVSGAAQGIGLAIAQGLVQRGCQVVMADPGTGIDGHGADPTIVKQAAAALGAAALPFADSIASPAAAQAAVELAVKRFGGVDIVVNNAAILRDAFIFKLDPGDFEAVIRANLLAAAYVLGAATPVMRDQVKAGRGGEPYGWGRLVNIVSTAGFYGNYGQAAYASAKAGLIGLTRVAALDMARSQVTCNAVAPFAATRVTESIKPANDGQAQYKARALTVSPVHVANFVAFLSGPAAQGISGQIFGVRGRELFLFSQSRPIARVASPAGEWSEASLSEALAKDFAGRYVELGTDLEAFSGEPLI